MIEQISDHKRDQDRRDKTDRNDCYGMQSAMRARAVAAVA
jgi:hypothetical protein